MGDIGTILSEAFDGPLEPRKKENSAAFDKASYEADGGDNWFDARRLPFYEHPQDKALWDKAKGRSLEIYTTLNKKFAIWLYQKLGGKF